jgi:Lipopolysaccharide-assembly
MRRFGVFLGSLALLSLAGCMYSFAGGGLPPNIGTMAIAPFDNQTTSPDLPKELYDQMHAELQKRLGVRDAPRERADALAHGTIVSYDADIPVSFSANPQQAVTARRRLQVTIEVEIIDQSNGHVLYQNKSLREEADYAERAEGDGRKQAITKLVQKIIEGVQSNW